MQMCQFLNDKCAACGAPRFNARQVCGTWSPGLGDRLAAGLAAVGITQDRAQAAAERVGLEDCGCEKRRQWLNAAGRRLGIGNLPDESGPEQSDV